MEARLLNGFVRVRRTTLVIAAKQR